MVNHPHRSLKVYTMIDGLDHMLEESGQPGLPELRASLHELFGGPGVAGRVIDRQQLKKRVYRLRFAIGDRDRSLVVKCMDPEFAQRSQFVIKRWLPAVGLGASSSPLLAVAAERSGQCIWHVYEDLGDRTLDASDLNPGHVAAVVELIAQLHTRFAGHPLLLECRQYSGDLGIYYFSSNVRDAIRGLELLRTLLIDWDRAGVGPISYDLSTFLLRFPTRYRLWILELYRETIGHAGWCLPSARDLNLLFETAECARYANRVIWPAIALSRERAEWGYDELAAVEQWFELLEPVLPE